MTNDLISRAALLKAIRAYADSKVLNEGLETVNNILRTVQVIEAAPAVEAEPVVHGRWTGNYHSHCSVCDCFDTYAYIGRYTNFCPHCGAKMDGGNDNG